LFILMLAACRPAPVDYQAIDDLPNPGRGWTTFNSFNGEEFNRQYPASTIAYFRFTWRRAEPAEGAYAFTEMDALFEKARATGQRIAFRINADAGSDGAGVPDWLLAKGIAGWRYRCQDGSDCFSPDAAAGTAAVQVALLDPTTDKPAIRFDMPGGNAELWYDIGIIDLE
jgi:hypothetical protein